MGFKLSIRKVKKLCEEIFHFIECVEWGTPVRVRPEESLRVQKIIDALYASSRKDREVRIA